MNKLLSEQIENFLGDTRHSPEMIAFLQEISRTYNRYQNENAVLKDLEKTNNQLDQFAYIVSHDLKAPLRAISSISNWIEEDLGNNINDETKDNFLQLKARVQRMENLIEGILNYSKASKTSSVSKVNINDIVNEVFNSINTRENVKIDCNISIADFQTEKIKLEQIFSNLISNAIKYNDKEGCEIFVQAIELEDTFQFSIRDNGPGIDKKYHQKIFEIFQTLQSRDSIESTGIGLSIVKKIVEEKGGKIWVESNIGQGANFVFTWPKLRQTNSREIIKSNQ